MPGKCGRCGQNVYAAEERLGLGRSWHARCFTCAICNRTLDSTNLAENRELGEIYCKACYRNKFATQGYGYGPNEPTLLALPSLDYVPNYDDDDDGEAGAEEEDDGGQNERPPRPPPPPPPPFPSHSSNKGAKPKKKLANNYEEEGDFPSKPSLEPSRMGRRYEESSYPQQLPNSRPSSRRQLATSRTLEKGMSSQLDYNRERQRQSPHQFRSSAPANNNSRFQQHSRHNQPYERHVDDEYDEQENSSNEFPRAESSSSKDRHRRRCSEAAKGVQSSLKMHKECARGRCGENASPRYPPRPPIQSRRVPLDAPKFRRPKSSTSVVNPDDENQLSNRHYNGHQHQAKGHSSGSRTVVAAVSTGERKNERRKQGPKKALGGGEPCRRCERPVYWAEMKLGHNGVYHQECFTCCCCKKPLESTTVCESQGEIYCKGCYRRFFGTHGIGYGIGAGTLQTP